MALTASHFPNLNRSVNMKRKNCSKVHLIFDEAKRKDYLTGFRKRKQQRRQKAHDKFTLKLKEEKKRIKNEVTSKYMSMSRKDVPELEELLSQKEYEADGKTVSILELNLDDLTCSSNWIGNNTLTYDQISGNTDVNLVSKSAVNHDNKMTLSKRELSRTKKKKTALKTLKSKVFQRKQNLQRKKNKKASQNKKPVKLRASKKK